MRDDASRRERDTAEDLSEASIRAELRSLALQHPATIIPFAIVVLCVVYLLIFPSRFIPPVLVIIVLILSALVAVGFFVWIYSVRHDKEYARLVQQIMATQRRESREVEEAEVTGLRDTLKSGFTALESAAGLKALTDLDYEYEQLRIVLNRQDETASMSIAHIPGLAEETYQQGLNVLANGLQLSQAIHTSNQEKLEEEIAEIEKEMESLKKDGTQARRVSIREETVALHKDRLEMISQQQARVDEVFYQCDRCEASLARTRIELAALQAGSSGASVSGVTETLRRTIDQAKEIQEELKKLGF